MKYTIRSLLIEAIIESERGDDEVFSYVQDKKETITCNKDLLPLIRKHFHQSLSHRKWIYYAFLMVDAGACFLQPLHGILKERMIKHDLSKFSAAEVLGYALKFGAGNRELDGEEILTWENSLSHHQSENDHHPQYFQEKNMPEISLIESVLDMLACRMERNISCENTSVDNIFAIPDIYLSRYSKTDRNRVSAFLKSWCEDLIGFVVTSSTMSPHSVNLMKLFFETD